MVGVRFQNVSGNVAAACLGRRLREHRRWRRIVDAAAPTALGRASPITLRKLVSKTVDVAGRAGVPNDAKAVVLAIRRGPKSRGELGVDMARERNQAVAALTWRLARGPRTVTQLIVPLGSTGALRLAADRSGPVSLQVAGYVASDTDRPVHPIVPRALLGDGAKLSAGKARTVRCGDVQAFRRRGSGRRVGDRIVPRSAADASRSGRVDRAEPKTADVMVREHRTSE